MSISKKATIPTWIHFRVMYRTACCENSIWYLSGVREHQDQANEKSHLVYKFKCRNCDHVEEIEDKHGVYNTLSEYESSWDE